MSHRKFAPLLMLLLSTLVLAATAGAQGQQFKVYVPQVLAAPRPSLFAFETGPGTLANPTVKAQAANLPTTWVRLNGVIWHDIQPAEGGAYNWGAVATLDRDLTAARELGLTPTVIIRGAPRWASVTTSYCSAVRDDKLGAYATFLQALATRYRGIVDYWELGNEPDVDPRLIPESFPFGCLGDIDDPYYGGERYGRMLRVAAAAIKQGNPSAKIIFGGLLLDRPDTSAPGFGRPEFFLEGALRAGAGDAFDILAFHTYPSYSNQRFFDHDLQPNGPWASRGGWVRGKAAYLREVMARYGVNKPLWLNETGLLCTPPWAPCEPPSADFFAAQADFLPRLIARSASIDIKMVAWYTLDGPGWRSAGLLDDQQQPRPAFRAFQQMARMIEGYTRVESVDYGPEIEAYRFVKPQSAVDVLWSRSSATQVAAVPLTKFLAAQSVDGNSVPGQTSGLNALINVGFSPVYIERTP